ncbi:SMI1/KNR4 family protein [Stenotrophomonas maltophilia]|uniref:SMI1/KNR4 family protein n=1 Tax=Stenotrophomonas riyadhensis TaxID=2859893 RepID=A0ABT2XBK7_9GAMM|nr:SMI1/KNR4 family protein [Stenotrophomonas sp. CFS3442]MBH1616996.1 SMI1/KNR4 family protein [Stenotrophomonas maltophilia]MCV0323329.1 SMI1/KNR4 family protein [Stenotrophomonas sp. CFS3442]HEL4244291.1 SMI1/KNR4 family protein [Stenotrophomonas maltophilia]
MKVLYSGFLKFLVAKGWSLVGRSDRDGVSPSSDNLVNSDIPAYYLEFLLNFLSLANEDESRWFVSIEEFAGVSDSAFSWDEFEKMSIDAAMTDADGEDVRKFWVEYLPIFIAVDRDYQFVGLDRSSGVVVHGVEPDFESVTRLAETFDEFLVAAMNGQYDELFFGR